MSYAVFDKTQSNITFNFNVGIGTSSALLPLHVQGNQYLNGNLGIGTTSPLTPFHLTGVGHFSGAVGVGSTQPISPLDVNVSSSSNAVRIRQAGAADALLVSTTASANALRVMNDGKVGVGTATALTTFHVQGTHFTSGNLGIGTITPLDRLHLWDSTAETAMLIQSGTSVNRSELHLITKDNDKSALAYFNKPLHIGQTTDGTLANTQPTMVFSMSNNVGVGTTDPQDVLHVQGSALLTRNSDGQIVNFTAYNASYTSTVARFECARAGNTNYVFMNCLSSIGGGSDTEFKVRGDGTVTADGTVSGGGADYAEFFEWQDGNPASEDRVGCTVVLDGTKIRLSTSLDNVSQIIGVVSARPTVTGDGAWDMWIDKYLKDGYGRYVMEDYSVVTWQDGRNEVSYDVDNVPAGTTIPSSAVYSTQQRRKLNPSFDPSLPYVPREQRKEWSPIGMVGKLRIRKGQMMGDRWIKMRDIDANIEEWIVR